MNMVAPEQIVLGIDQITVEQLQRIWGSIRLALEKNCWKVAPARAGMRSRDVRRRMRQLDVLT